MLNVIRIECVVVLESRTLTQILIFTRAAVTISLHEWGVHKIWEVVSYVYVNEFD